MPPPVDATILQLEHADPVAADRAAARAAEVLAAGGVVLLPTETLYGLACRAGLAHARAKQGELSGRAPHEPSTWHAPSAEDLLAAVRPPAPLHRRIIERLTPGPVRLEISRDAMADGAWPIPGIAEGVSDRSGVLAVRVPSHPVARAVLRHAGGPVIVDRVPPALGDGRTAPKAAPGLELVLDAGAATHGRASTPVRLRGRGGEATYDVGGGEGALSDRAVHRRIARRILFVCTGNTCRSPMAAAIARSRLEHASGGATLGGLPLLGGVPTDIASAGVSAAEGEPASPQTAEALRAVGVASGTGRHRARGLTEAEARDADVIFAMTRSHARAIAAMGPQVATRVQLLDPSGADIPDPVGGSAALYISTARRLDALIETQFRQFQVPGGTP